jgi:hypothetical protein
LKATNGVFNLNNEFLSFIKQRCCGTNFRVTETIFISAHTDFALPSLESTSQYPIFFDKFRNGRGDQALDIPGNAKPSESQKAGMKPECLNLYQDQWKNWTQEYPHYYVPNPVEDDQTAELRDPQTQRCE